MVRKCLGAGLRMYCVGGRWSADGGCVIDLSLEVDGLGGGVGGGVAVGELGLVAPSRREVTWSQVVQLLCSQPWALWSSMRSRQAASTSLFEVVAALPFSSTATSSLETELVLVAGAALEMAWARALVVLALLVLALVVLALANPNLAMSLSRAALEVARACALVVLALVTLALVVLASRSLAMKGAFSIVVVVALEVRHILFHQLLLAFLVESESVCLGRRSVDRKEKWIKSQPCSFLLDVM